LSNKLVSFCTLHTRKLEQSTVALVHKPFHLEHFLSRSGIWRETATCCFKKYNKKI